MLNTYISRTQRLLQNPSPAQGLYSPSDITDYVNIARGQVAGEGNCVRYRATITTVPGQQEYQFIALDTGVSAVTGIQGVIHVRSLFYDVALGQKRIEARSWPWFELYYLNTAVPTPGTPANWSQYSQGAGAFGGTQSSASGSFFLDPPPDAVYTLTADCVCYPISLVQDTDVEALPYLWTDSVPYYGAYLALLSSQTSTRQADANRMFQAYQEFVQRARTASTPAVQRYSYEQSPDPTLVTKLGLKQQGAG